MMKMRFYKNIFYILSVTSFLIVMMPGLAHAQIVPCDTDCGFQDLIILVNRLINWMVVISIPISAGVFAWVGFLLMTTGIADKRNEAKDMAKKVAYGLVFILGAWILVTTITNSLLGNGFDGVVSQFIN